MVRITMIGIALFTALALWAALPQPGTARASGVAAPDIGGDSWINSKSLTIAGLKGRVVLVEFWTYG